MIPDIIFAQLPLSEITHKLVRPRVEHQVKQFIDDGQNGGAFTAIGMPPNETSLGNWTLFSLAENGIKTQISMSSCEEDQENPNDSNCIFRYA
jgi:hypothetical protein